MGSTIVHITDPHFGNAQRTYSCDQVGNALIEKINKEPGDKVLVITGDVTYKAGLEGYREAKDFFDRIIRQCNIARSNIIVCPGNHDIVPETTFKDFDDFVYALRRDEVFSMSQKNEAIFELNDMVFVASNSSHHLDRTYGLISDSTIKLLSIEKKRILQFKYKIFLTHHHLISQRKDDLSTIRNTHKLLYSLEQLGFSYVLHGHQHSSVDLSFGEVRTKILAGRSLNFHDKGFHNGFSTIAVETGIIKRFIATPDGDPTKLIFEEL